MSQITKRIVLIFLAVSLVSMMVLAAGLSGLQLLPGVPFPGSDSAESPAAPTAPPVTRNDSIGLLQGILAFLFLAIAIYLAAMLLARLEIKKLALPLAILAALFLLLLLLPSMAPDQSISYPQSAAELPGSAATEYPTSPLGEPPTAFTWIVLSVLAAGMGLFAFLFLRKPAAGNANRDALQQEAAQAIDALRAGEPFQDVIIRCYLRMAYVLQEQQGLEREGQMTPREFEHLLEARGIPSGPVHQLTRLFEKVRYGGQPASDEDQRLGMQSLDQIVIFCAARKG